VARTRVYRDVKIYSGGYDLSGTSNQLEIAYEFDKVEVKHFGQACHYSVKGLPRLTWHFEGNAYSNAIPAGSEDVLFSQLGAANIPMTWCPVDGTQGDVAYFAKTMQSSYQAGGAVGEMYAFTVEGEGENAPLVRGRVLDTGSRIASGTSTPLQLGAVTADQQFYACLHVLAIGGTSPTMTCSIQSDDAQTFASPATRATFSAVTGAIGIGAQYLVPVAGPITDTWWRASYTITGTNPTFTIVLVAGIQ